MTTAKVKGYGPQLKYFFDLTVQEGKTLRPAQIAKLAEEMQDYPFKGFEVTSIRGTVTKDGEAYRFTAAGSKQEYRLKPSDELKKLVASGKTGLTLGGKLSETKEKEKSVLTLEVSAASETSK